MTRRLDARTAAALAVLLLATTVGLMLAGAPPVMVWCVAASAVSAGLLAMAPHR
ncbi:hypothetical protein HQ325_02365 [Rhodococcus sp. BP-349]|uniref:hypothetical protein n=1 Tax=unclassified Rhodococcus (in: high G+C Gram-positive bacteria) TaxID=192944 RepID=UPI001C9A3323|nr:MULTISPECIES: hypothetical protein [unclassified Rhodococcus (in: high G+C Gram-positive bacteria)]MBY6537506.1 hypothetical protein [Rhodococcus sp. BP-363]MBY6541843.1 hypothetical protein [Rhodococcus sp. BP-369]MBY6561073.1 hypothetical protein [Rhodococcus sp. BP-370]MBY6575365.1 hypothetical protein [Rhodococcus sp. BP-364]MBY6584666.1 hypothetical protein [Rhodococcus sp. BP-358]